MLKKLLPGFATLRVLHKASVTHQRAVCDPQVTAESMQAAVAVFLSDIEPHLGFSPYALREVGFFAAAALLVVGLLAVRVWL